MINKFTPIIVLCEGISEFNYIQNLNRILCNPNTGSAAFKPYTINTGRFSQIRQKFNQVKKIIRTAVCKFGLIKIYI